MRQRIQRQPARVSGGRIAQFIGHPAVRVLVDGQRKENPRSQQQQFKHNLVLSYAFGMFRIVLRGM